MTNTVALELIKIFDNILEFMRTSKNKLSLEEVEILSAEMYKIFSLQAFTYEVELPYNFESESEIVINASKDSFEQDSEVIALRKFINVVEKNKAQNYQKMIKDFANNIDANTIEQLPNKNLPYNLVHIGTIKT